MSVFRVSDWVKYEPAVESRNRNRLPDPENQMDGDVDMDAPQISTLREEETPPPQRTPTHSSRFRVKLLVKDSGSAPSPSGSDPYWLTMGYPRKQAGQTEDEVDDFSDEEDQLIDDDDDDMKPSSDAKLTPSRAAEISPKRKQPSHKRKPRKTDKRIAEGEKKSREHDMQADAANLAPTMTWFEATLSESHPGEEHGQGGGLEAGPSTDNVPPEPHLSKASPKKKPLSKKAPQAPRPKPKVPLKIKPAIPPLLADEAGMLSEGYSVTAASSPVAAHFDANTPEPDNVGTSSAPLVEDINLDSVPLPVFPLPSKPFPVQPPIKIGSGFAPIIPLDKSRKKVRHWRTANREIRGIAGGRWFARSWVGEKESEFASAAATSTKDGEKQPAVALPKLSSVSISAPPSGRGKSKASKASLTGSAIPSRAGSAIPDNAAPRRAPTKMRTMLSAAPPSEEGNDSDMVAPPGS